MRKVIIAGSRTFNDFNFLKNKCYEFIPEDSIVVSGGAKGADALGEKYAKHWGHLIKKFPANWDEYGKKAGYLRNEEMAKYADMLIVFWDGQSKGTKHMIDLALKYKLETHVFIYETT